MGFRHGGRWSGRPACSAATLLWLPDITKASLEGGCGAGGPGDSPARPIMFWFASRAAFPHHLTGMCSKGGNSFVDRQPCPQSLLPGIARRTSSFSAILLRPHPHHYEIESAHPPRRQGSAFLGDQRFAGKCGSGASWGSAPRRVLIQTNRIDGFGCKNPSVDYWYTWWRSTRWTAGGGFKEVCAAVTPTSFGSVGG